jgi:hypothetical protein
MPRTKQTVERVSQTGAPHPRPPASRNESHSTERSNERRPRVPRPLAPVGQPTVLATAVAAENDALPPRGVEEKFQDGTVARAPNPRFQMDLG